MALVHEPVSTNKLETIDNSRAAYPFQKDDQIGASYATNLGFDQAVVWFTMVGVDGGWLGNGIRVKLHFLFSQKLIDSLPCQNLNPGPPR